MSHIVNQTTALISNSLNQIRNLVGNLLLRDEGNLENFQNTRAINP